MTRLSQRYAIRQRQIDENRTLAIKMMDSPLGQEALADGFYTEMFGWLFNQLEAGRTPAGVPAKLLEEWRSMGEFRRKRSGVV